MSASRATHRSWPRSTRCRPSFATFDNSSRSKYYYVKGTAQISPKHQLYGFYQYDLNPEEANWAYSASKLYVSTFGGNGTGSRLTSIWNDKLTTKVLVAYNDKSLNGTLSAYDNYPGTGPGIEVYSSAALSSGRLTGAGQIAQLGNLPSRSAQPATKLTFSADATYYKAGLLGNHEIQTGVYAQQFGYTSTVVYSNDGDALWQGVINSPANPALGYTVFSRRVYDRTSVQNADVAAHDYAVYVQDAWKVTPRLTFNVGVRFDQVTATDQLFDVDVLNAWHVGPRFGATYALTANRTSILRGTWGRVHDIPNSTYLGTAGTQAAGYTDYLDNNLDGVFETVLPQPASSRLSSDRVIDPERHQPFIDEWLIGYQQQFPGQLSVDVSWVNRNYKDRPALVETNGIYDGGVFSGVIDESQNLIYRVTNNEWNWFVYNGFEITVAKRTAKMQLLGQLHAQLPASRRHMAAERPGLVHPAGRVRQQSRPRHDSRQRDQQPFGDVGHAQPVVAEAHASHRRRLLPAVGIRGVGQLHAALRSLHRTGRRAHCRRGSAVRSLDRAALERADGRQPAGDDHPLRRADTR